MFSKLPEDIIEQIIDNIVVDNSNNLHDWKVNLPLLAVCSHWRAVAAPTVYGTMYAQNGAGTNNDNAVVTGNTDLVCLAKAQHVVRRLFITYDISSCPLLFLGNVINKLKLSNAEWVKLKRLHLNINYSDIVDTPEYVAEVDDTIKNLIANFNHVLPHINSIISHNCQSLLDAVWVGRLADSYAPKLTRLCSYENLQLSAQSFSAELTYLHININMHLTAWVPQIFAKSLQYLCLDTFANDFSWKKFSDVEDDGQNINFTNLKTLIVFYGRNISEFGANGDNRAKDLAIKPNENYKLHFPKLQTIRLNGVPENCYILKSGVFPSCMKDIHIQGSSESVIYLEKANLKWVNNFSIYSYDIEREHPVVIGRALNQLLNRMNVSKELVVEMADFSPRISFENIKWPELTSLQSLSVVDGFMLLQLLPRLPKLQRVVAHDLRAGIFLQDLEIPEADSGNKLVPFTTELAFLMINFAASTKYTQMIFLKHILLRTCSLRCLDGDSMHNRDLTEFFEEYKNAYPHLANIRIGR